MFVKVAGALLSSKPFSSRFLITSLLIPNKVLYMKYIRVISNPDLLLTLTPRYLALVSVWFGFGGIAERARHYLGYFPLHRPNRNPYREASKGALHGD